MTAQNVDVILYIECSTGDADTIARLHNPDLPGDLSCGLGRLVHDDRVAVFQKNVLFEMLALEHLVVVEFEALLAVVANDQDALGFGEIAKSASQAERVEDPGGLDQGEHSGVIHLIKPTRIFDALS